MMKFIRIFGAIANAVIICSFDNVIRTIQLHILCKYIIVECYII